MAAVCLELRLAGAARAYGRGAARGRLTHQVRPHAREAGEKVLVLRQLDLQLALARARPLGEDVEYEPAAVEHAHAQLLREDAHLARRELVVEDREVAAGVRDELLELGDLAAADKAPGVGRGALLQYGAHDLAAGRLDQRGELVHALVGRALALVHAPGREPAERGALFLLGGVVQFNPSRKILKRF